MKKRTISLLCVTALTFWLFALAFGSAQGKGVHSVAATYNGATEKNRSVNSQALPQEESAATSQGQAGVVLQENLATKSTGEADTLPQQAIEFPAPPRLPLSCISAILVEQTSGRVLYELNADDIRPIASITKVMTLLLTFEAIHDGKIALDDTVSVSAHAYEMGGSQIWLEPGETFVLEELIKAICVSSANDAAVAVAEYVGGSEDVFVEMMNTRAAELGMTETTYRNACGLDEENHLSSARDVAMLSAYILNTCPEVLNYTGIWTDTLRGGETHLANTNKLLKHYSGITGLKTGTTGGAGVCISASATRDDLSLIAVVLGSASSAERFQSAMTMLDYGFATYQAVTIPPASEAPNTQMVKGGLVEEVTLDYTAVPKTLVLPKGNENGLNAVGSFPQEVSAPVEKGAQLGSVMIYSGEMMLGEYPVTAASEVSRMTVRDAMQKLWESLIGKTE